MKNTKKVLLGGVAALALVGTSVFGTYMYLTSQDSVTNTFTVGNVKITLDEAKVDTKGEVINAPRVQTNDYHIYPGGVYDKDPTVHVAANSENCWVFVKVENGLTAVPTINENGELAKDEDGNPITLNIESNDAGYTNIATQITNNHWMPLMDGNTRIENVYYYQRVCTNADQDLLVFSDFKIDNDLSTDDYASLQLTPVNENVPDGDQRVNSLIKVSAYAVQADGFATAYAAWSGAGLN